MHIFILITGIIIGVAMGPLLVKYYQDFLLEYAISAATYLMIFLAGAVLLIFLCFATINRYAKRKLGIKDYSAETIADRLNTLLWQALTFNRTEARRTSRQLIGELVSLYSMVTFYRWSLATLVAIVTAVGGTLGTILLVKQTDKLAEQTEVAKEQIGVNIQESIRMKGDELALIATKINHIRGMLKLEQFSAVSTLYTRHRTSRCWDDRPPSKRDCQRSRRDRGSVPQGGD